MGPGDDDNVTVPAVAKTLVKLVMNGDEPVLADDGLGARNGIIEDCVERVDRDPATVETWQPAVSLSLSLQAFAQLAQAWRCGLKSGFCLASDPREGVLVRCAVLPKKRWSRSLAGLTATAFRMVSRMMMPARLAWAPNRKP